MLSCYNGYSGNLVLLAKGGRVRVLIYHNPSDNEDYYILLGAPGKLPIYKISESHQTVQTTIARLRQIYGEIPFTPAEVTAENETITAFGKTYTRDDLVNADGADPYSVLGFIEGKVYISTPVGTLNGMIKNGVLYPIISEYNSVREDHETLSGLFLNGTNEVADLQQMLDNSGRYFTYANYTLRDLWSPIENYLHQKLQIGIVAKIAKDESSSGNLGAQIPGVSYSISL